MGLSDEHEEEEEVEEEDEEEVEEQGEMRPASGDSAGVTMTRGGFGGCWCARADEAAAPLEHRGGCRHDARWLGSRRIFSSFIFSDVRRWISVLRRTFMSSTDSDSWGGAGD